jgi:hypothetical protein
VYSAEVEIDAVTPPSGSRKAQITYDDNAYGLRHLIECLIDKALPLLREDCVQLHLDALPRCSAMIWLL